MESEAVRSARLRFPPAREDPLGSRDYIEKEKKNKKFELVRSNWIIIDENVIYRKIKKKKCVFAFTGGEGKRRKELRLDK